MASVLFFSTSQNGGALANILNQCFNFNFLIENCNCLNTIKNTHLYSYSFLSLYFHCPGFPPALGLTQIIHTWQWWEKTPNNLHPGLFSPFGNNVTAILHFLLPNDVLTLAEESLKWIFHFLLDHSSVDGISYFHIVDNPQINTFVYVAFPSIEFSSWDKLRTWVKNNKTGFLGGGAGGAWHICCQIDFQKSYTNKNTHQVCGCPSLLWDLCQLQKCLEGQSLTEVPHCRSLTLSSFQWSLRLQWLHPELTSLALSRTDTWGCPRTIFDFAQAVQGCRNERGHPPPRGRRRERC